VAPFGHAVTIHISSMTTIVANTRTAAMTAGNTSVPWNQKRRRYETSCVGSTSAAKASATSERPRSARATPSASERSDGVSGGSATKDRTALLHRLTREPGSSIQGDLADCEPSCGGYILKTMLDSRRPSASPSSSRQLAAVLQPDKATVSPSVAA